MRGGRGRAGLSRPHCVGLCGGGRGGVSQLGFEGPPVPTTYLPWEGRMPPKTPVFPSDCGRGDRLRTLPGLNPQKT